MPSKRKVTEWACLGLLVTFILGANTAFVVAAEFLTTTDWRYLKSLGYEEHAYAFERATRGQRKHLHKLINSQRYTATRKRELIDSYLFAIGLEAPIR
jgi:hypothetical protein